MRVTATTRVFALLGDPVAHSLSPVIQNRAFEAAGLDAVYLVLPCAVGDLPGVIRSLVAGGGGGNVTLPHKAAAGRVGRPDRRVATLGVANVFAGREGEVVVGNTDVDGVLALLDRLEAPATTWCVVGTGGSARAVASAAAERGVRLAVRSRDPERGAAFLQWAGTLGVEPAEWAEGEVLVNATPLGLHPGDPPPVDLAELPRLAAVADLTYRRREPTALVAMALGRGLRAADGREMLLIQGAAAWQWWFPGTEAPVEVMRAALEGAVG